METIRADGFEKFFPSPRIVQTNTDDSLGARHPNHFPGACCSVVPRHHCTYQFARETWTIRRKKQQYFPHSNNMQIHSAYAISQHSLWIQIKCFRLTATVRLPQLPVIEWFVNKKIISELNSFQFDSAPPHQYRHNRRWGRRRAHCSHRINYLFIISCQCGYNCSGHAVARVQAAMCVSDCRHD